jgi:hypothetical protein
MVLDAFVVAIYDRPRAPTAVPEFDNLLPSTVPSLKLT